MTIQTIAASKEDRDSLVSLAEDHFVDLKSRQIAPASAQKHVIAFANADGGDLYIGIEDASTIGPRIRGFPDPESANDLIHTLFSCEPAIDGLEFEFLEFRPGGLVLHVDVPKSPRVHYTSSQECYVRRNASTRRIKGDAITRLSFAKGSFSYENQLVDTTADDIVQGEPLAEYLARIESKLAPEVFLRKQKLIVDMDGKTKPTVAGILLFDDEPQATLETRCATKVYRLNTTEKEYKREYLAEHPTTIEGPIEQQARAVVSRVTELLKDATYKVAGERVKLNYPPEALFEILINAVIHRDYSVNDDIHVRVYDNRIEVQSPGRLPGAVTIENILDERYARNPRVVRLLHKLPDPVNHDIGEGLNTAANALHSAGLVPPEFDELETAFQVTIEHRTIASLEDTIVEYLRSNDTIKNKTVRELSGEDSENKVKKSLQNLRTSDIIEPVDPNASAFKFEYRKGPNFPRN